MSETRPEYITYKKIYCVNESVMSEIDYFKLQHHEGIVFTSSTFELLRMTDAISPMSLLLIFSERSILK